MRTKNTRQIQVMIAQSKRNPTGVHVESRGSHTFYVFRHRRTRAHPYDYCHITTQDHHGVLQQQTQYVNEEVEPEDYIITPVRGHDAKTVAAR